MRFIFFLATIVFSSSAVACDFSWSGYGANPTTNRLKQVIGQHVTDEYCRHFAKTNEIVIQLDSTILSNDTGCVGHASVSMRAKSSNIQQDDLFNAAVVERSCRTKGRADQLAVGAAENAIDTLMSNLDYYKETK